MKLVVKNLKLGLRLPKKLKGHHAIVVTEVLSANKAMMVKKIDEIRLNKEIDAFQK